MPPTRPSQLYELLVEDVNNWRKSGYPVPDYPAISEIMQYQTNPDTGELRFLRRPQFQALETYWYMRLVQGTPTIGEFYRRLHKDKRFGPRLKNFVDALGIPADAFDEADNDIDELLRLVETNEDDFAGRYKLTVQNEMLSLKYPSYILALAMGVGKTILMGAIVATEFAMALEYPKIKYPDSDFVENVLVFAPDKTVLRALRELEEMQYEDILPPHLYAQFAPNFHPAYTRDGERDVPVIRGSSFNVVVTNTDKIRIRQENILKSQLGALGGLSESKAKADVANRRLQTIATLPYLAVFSDEAHHTYGQPLEEMKQVRKTVDYLDRKARELRTDQRGLVCVINTTGTPYHKKQPLKDVVFFYGLAEGIADGILKEVRNGIRAYSMADEDTPRFVTEVVSDFFQQYGDYRLPNGAWAKLAIYFPQNDDLDRIRPFVEQALIAAGQSTEVAFRYTSLSSNDEKDAFERFTYDPKSPHRVVLLVDKGKEGWNCPSLFACALARKLTTSNNFVLQAATRCLRQVPGNTEPARIYLSDTNRKALDTQLQNTYGEDTTFARLDRTQSDEGGKITLHLLKPKIDPLYITVPVTKVNRRDGVQQTMMSFAFKPVHLEAQAETVTAYQFERRADGLEASGGPEVLNNARQMSDLYTIAIQLADRYRVDLFAMRKALTALYPGGDVPADHVPLLASQLEKLCCDYEQEIRYLPVALALVKLSGWHYDATNNEYTLSVARPKDKPVVGEDRLDNLRRIATDPKAYGYHYAPYVFGSHSEAQFLDDLLAYLKTSPDDVEDVYFTGGLTDENKTDFYVEYTKADGTIHHYYPDFVIRKRPRGDRPGPCLIVEVKSSAQRPVIEKEIKAVIEGGEALSSAYTDEARKTIYSMEWVQHSNSAAGNHLEYTMVFDNDVPRLTKAVKDFINPLGNAATQGD